MDTKAFMRAEIEALNAELAYKDGQSPDCPNRTKHDFSKGVFCTHCNHEKGKRRPSLGKNVKAEMMQRITRLQEILDS